MRKYDLYKESDVTWLTEIPKHWSEKKMRFIGYLYGGLSGKSAKDFNQMNNVNNKKYIPFTNIANNLVIDPENLDTVVITDDENQNLVKKGDLFFLMSSENYEDIGKTAILRHHVTNIYLNSFCKGFRITDMSICPSFMNYQLNSKIFRYNLLIEANGFTS